MKTNDLINALVADTRSSGWPIGEALTTAVVCGFLASAALLLVTIGPRADIDWVVQNSLWFLLKFVVTLSVAVPAYLIVKQLARPDGEISRLKLWLFLPVAVLVLWAIVEFLTLPRALWEVSAVGPTWSQCVMLIPLFSLAPLAAVLIALKHGAPANPVIAGGFGGLLSGALGATLYATHCIEDSPFFVGLWYPVGIAAVTLLGALAGWRLLRW